MSIFPARILLATDGSADAELALATAVDIAKSTDSELHVVTAGPGNPDPVYGIHEAGLQYETYEQALEAVEREAQRVLDEQVRKVEELGGKVAGAYLSRGQRRDQAKFRRGHTGPGAGRGRKWGSREESTAEAAGVGAARGGARFRGGLGPHGKHLVLSRGRRPGRRAHSHGALLGGLTRYQRRVR